MRLDELLDVAASAFGERVLFEDDNVSLTATGLTDATRRIAALVASMTNTALPIDQLVFIGTNSVAVPIGLYSASAIGVPFTPINYRSADDRLQSMVDRTGDSLVVIDDEMADRITVPDDARLMTTSSFLSAALDPDGALGDAPTVDGGKADDTAVLLFTSGTTGEPKIAVLRHENLTSYVLATVEFASATEGDAALVAVPPYHIAGISAAISAPFAGRRTIYLPSFDPAAWIEVVRSRAVSHAMLVPTMLERILGELEDPARRADRDESADDLSTLRSISYGGGPMPRHVIERALERLPDVGFVNAYGLTETASTIALLGPDDHRIAVASDRPEINRRLTSVGRPLPSVELSIRDPLGVEVAVGERGEIWARGDQVSGTYAGRAPSDDGWFHTRDEGELDDDGYLYLHGRLDDVIVRGGENLSPGEIEQVLIQHVAIASCAVVGIPDEEWGEAVVAAVVVDPTASGVSEEALRAHVRATLRSTQTPERISFRKELPMNETGKLLRRVIRDELTIEFGAPAAS
jgi:acyl-CoA synthetase (AMP-forming)/AMP-acid ligase II